MIDWAWWVSHLAWFTIGGFIGFFVGFLIASMMAVSSSISRWEEAQAVQLEPAPMTQDDALLAEAEAKAEFYYRMATGQEAT